MRVAASGWIRRGSAAGGANVGEQRGWLGESWWVGVGDGYGIWWEIPWHETSLLDQSVPDACADVQYCTRIRRGFVPGRVPL